MRKTPVTTPLVLILGLVLIFNNSCQKNDCEVDGPLVSIYYTTLKRTIVVDSVPATMTKLRPSEVALYSLYGYGKWHYGSGLACQKRLDLMPSGYTSTSAVNSAKLLRFFAMTDIHITDEESPASAIFFSPYAGNSGVSCYSPVMLYSTQVLDAAINTVNAINKQNPFDFGIALGDITNNDQYNELRWFIDILDGKTINPDSGIKDDPVPGPNNDYQDEFQARGLGRSIPWYAVIGNHDHLWMGVKPVNERIRQSLTGTNILQLGMVFTDPLAMNKSTYSVGALDGSSIYGNIIGSGVVANMPKIPTVAADQNRRPISTTEFMNEFSVTTSLPKGHGFIQSNTLNKFGACYSFEPKSDLPLKVIVLDDTEDESDIPGPSLLYGYGSLGNGRYEWLLQQLQAGQNDDKLMIIAAHVPIGVATGTPLGWYNNADEAAIITKLKTYPNLILFLAGHRHVNLVTPFKSDDPAHPENGFWQVETKSLREFPQQFRTFDIVRNSDNNISIIITNIDPDINDSPFAAISRTYAIAAEEAYQTKHPLLPTGSVSYNAELVKQLSTRMQEKIKALGSP